MKMNFKRQLTGIVWLWVLMTAPAGANQNEPYLHSGPILLSDIAVIDGMGHAVAPMRDVLIMNERIHRITINGQMDSLPDDTYRINGKGLTVLPGLIDAHVHIANIGFKPGESERRDMAGMDRALRAHLYAGVTTVLDLGSEPRPDLTIQLRDEIAAGKRVGPTLVTVGSTIHNLKTPETVFDLPSAETREEIKALLDERQEAGIEIIKLYAGITPWEARHIMIHAGTRGMRGIADFWCTNLSRTVFEVSLVDGYAHGGCRRITREEATWMSAHEKFALITLTLFETMGGQRAFQNYENRSYLENDLVVDVLGKQIVEDYYAAFRTLRESFEEGESSLYKQQHFPNLPQLLSDNMYNVKLLHEEGVLIGMGTDAAFPPGTWPGEAMHRELELHVQAGISPLDAIRMATHNNAVILGQEDERGAIKTGQIADLLIVKGDPASEISDTRNIVHVIKGGRLVNRPALARQN